MPALIRFRNRKDQWTRNQGKALAGAKNTRGGRESGKNYWNGKKQKNKTEDNLTQNKKKRRAGKPPGERRQNKSLNATHIVFTKKDAHDNKTLPYPAVEITALQTLTAGGATGKKAERCRSRHPLDPTKLVGRRGNSEAEKRVASKKKKTAEKNQPG